MTDLQNLPNLRRLRKYDRALLASALEELSRATPTYTGRSSSTRTRVFSARYESICERCGFQIAVGQDIRYHRDFSSAVHDGCRPPKVTIRTTAATAPPKRVAKTVPPQQPPLCPECHLEHAGVCW